ncbi:ATP-binding cassette domain-containing protein [Alkalicoccobacillus murimartini]|uniref:ABC-2 type transport system ATP-binding protein n=1 Tax=Alkalicoccobacillus murimartini TaxID=171685 RepID=A0ABT9YKZ0_9BACI|nr:ABC transporter ATP-binding protein [Alkalicoccobacillus murimartini]MDQ0208520.1 ABC-2 type transport system ATP-binding protein [Alkalicoccobacillus murimartini]
MSEPHIKAENLSLHIGKNRILNDISFDLSGNKIIGLLGRNSAGKTTLLSVLAAYHSPTIGTLKMNNRDIFEDASIVEQISFIKEESFEYEYDKAKKWLDDRGSFRANYDADYAAHLVKRFKIPMNKKVYNLSRGMKSALTVTLGLASRCPITIFDEAYLGMDAPAREIFYEEVLKDYMEHPRMIILSTHLISEMDSLFEEVLIIKEGSLLMQKNTEELLTEGVSVTGTTEKVDAWAAGKTILKEQTLGNTKSVMVFGSRTNAERQAAIESGLEFGPIALQDLFIHLTEEGADS